MSSTSPKKDATKLVPSIPSPMSTIVSPSIGGSMIDSRNVYKISPAKATVISPHQQDIVKIRLTKDDSGNGIGYTKSIITSTAEGNRSDVNTSNTSLIVINKDKRLTINKRDAIKTYFIKKPPATAGHSHQDSMCKNESSSKSLKNSNFVSDKTGHKTTPQKISINLAQQPTLQLKTAQNKIVLVKMLPKMPQNGPQVIAASNSRSSVSPTTLALARSVQGLRPLAPIGSPPSSTVNSFIVTKAPERKVAVPIQEIAKSESSSSISSYSTLATTSTTSASSTTFDSMESVSRSSVAETAPKALVGSKSEETLDPSSMMDVDNNDDEDSINNSSVNKMSREMRCLKASQSSSKILTEFMQDSLSTEKLRKRRRSRCDGEDSYSCGSLTPTSQQRYSVSGRDEDEFDDNKSSPSTSIKRTGMRSANAEFSMKQRKFLSSIHQHSDGSDNSDNEADQSNLSKDSKKDIQLIPMAPKSGWDKFCWRCKTCEPGLETCAGCIRCYHPVCLKMSPAFFMVEKKWNCPECIKLNPMKDDAADDGAKPGKDKLKIDSLTVSLKFAMKRMQQLKGSAILNPLDKEQFTTYDQYVTNHIDIAVLQKNITEQKYKTADEFQADVCWILHNTTIYPNNNKLLPIAKGLLKICKQELNEIEACKECYFNANTCKTWFTEVCTKPHLLVWAKLKGFPFWPAKLMSVNSNQLADVRFFGDHDRAWVPIKECFLFCEKDPNTKLQRRSNMAECMREAESYIEKLKKKFGQFRYTEFRTQVEANKLDEHLEAMIPGVLKRVAESGDSQRAKLMLRIVKTADNFLSVSPVSSSPTTTSTPKATRSESTSPEKIIKEVIFGSPKEKPAEISKIFEEPRPRARSRSTGPNIKMEIRNSVSTPEPTANTTRTYLTRKLKSGSPFEEVKVKEANTETSREARKRNSRTASNAGSVKVSEEDSSSAVSEPSATSGPRCYPSRKRKSVSASEDPVKEPKQSKIESVVIQRKSDSWKTVPAGKKKKSKSVSCEEKSDAKEEKSDETAAAPEVTEVPVPKPEQEQPTPPSKAAVPDDKPVDIAPIVTETTQKEDAPETKKTEDKLPLIPLVAAEIKTEPTEEEPPPVPAPAVEPPPAESAAITTSSDPPIPTTKKNTIDNAVVPQQLLPIKSEPLSDDETPPASDNLATGNSSDPLNTAVVSNQVLIRTSNRIMVKDINKLTNQIGTRANAFTSSNGQSLVLTPVEKPKGMPKIIPKAAATVQPKTRKVFPNQQQQQQQQQPAPSFVPLNRSTTIPSRVSVSLTGNFPGGKNGSNMMHMVHIPSPLPSVNEQSARIDQSSCTTSTNNPSQNRPQQQQQPVSTGTTETAPVVAAASSSTSTTPTPPALPQASVSGVPTVSVATSVATPSSATETSVEGQHMMAGFITPSLAAAVTETIVATPPKLQSRPSGALRSEGDCVYPSGAGPVSQILINNSYKMADFFRSVIEDTLADLSNNSGALEAKVKVLELEIEKLKHCHQQEITKLKHNSDLVLCEMRKNMELEKTRIINEVRKQCEIERVRSVEEAKKKQWCINCGKEALFYCCWNTSYCDYPCQQQHWATHMNSCTQSQFNLPSAAIASKPSMSNVINSKVTAQHITTPKITTVQTLNLNGRSGLTIQPAQQQHQQQLIITSSRGGPQLGKGQPFQRLMINPACGGQSSYTIVSSAPSKWSQHSVLSTAAIKSSISTSSTEQQATSGGASHIGMPPTPVGILTSSSVVAAAVSGGILGRTAGSKLVSTDKIVIGSK